MLQPTIQPTISLDCPRFHSQSGQKLALRGLGLISVFLRIEPERCFDLRVA